MYFQTVIKANKEKPKVDPCPGPYVYTATVDGWFTAWTSPVSTGKLLGWAEAADARFAGD